MTKILLASLLTFFSFALDAQLAAGDIAFIGYNSDGTDDFTFITLRDIPGSTVIYLTEEGWNSVTNTWVGTTETHLVFTAPSGGLPCGTVVHINETGADVFTIGSSVSGSTISLGAGASYTLSAGDQVLAYQATSPRPATTPTFIAGVHGDDGNGTPLTLDAITGWNDLCCTPAGVARSSVPAGLTNGVNCVSLFPSIGTEWDNAKYTGTLTGTSTVLRALINDRTNWSTDDITPYNITFGAYSPSVTCVAPCNSPTVPTVTFSPATVCAGSTATLTITGTLNDATAWHVYSGSCGGTLVGSTAGTSFVVTPGSPSTTYFVRGQGGCVVPGSCSSITINTAALDNASFTYSASSYCVNGSDPTPTVPGPAGTFTSSPAGLSINATTGTIDVSASTAGTYTITRTTSGACPNTATATIVVTNVDNASFSYSLATYCPNSVDPSPIITGVLGGVFASSPSGLTINSSTGLIDISSSIENTYTITYTTVGLCSNSSNQTVTIDDVTPPITPTLAALNAECSVTPSAPTTTDNCAGTITGTTVTTFPISVQGTTVVTWVFNDGNGNTTTATQSVIIDDVTPPITPTLAALNAECSVTPSAPTTTDNCAGTITGTTVTTFPISTQGTTVVTWMFDDGNDNTTTATQSVIIDDITPPITPTLAAINAECSVTPSAPTTTDNCAGTITGTTATTFPISTQGTTVVTWMFDDGNGNTTTATQSVIIDDVTPPITPTLAAINAECSVTPSAPTTTDNCAGTLTGTTVTTFPISVQGTTVVTWVFNDGNGNTTSATQSVIIDDVTPPVVIDCPSTITSAVNNSGCTAIVNWISPTSNDNCTVFPSIISSHIPGDIFPVGTTNVSYIFNDGNGNTASCSFDVIVSSPIVLNAVGTDVTCNGQSDAQIDLTVSGGTNPYTYDWNTGLFSTEDITGLNAGTYSVIVEDINNCSASSSVTITEPSAIEYAQSSTICFGESFTVGTNNYTTSGIYIDVLPAANGCDSTITTNLTVTSEIDITTVLDETTLISNQNGALYQWIDCNNGNALISGANNQVFSPLANGSYAVIVTSGSCSDTSACTTVSTIGITENINDVLIGLYPNPNNGQFTLELTENALVEVTDISGKDIFKSNLQKGANQLNLSHIETGVYFVTIITGGKQVSVKIVKE